jgi:hypothetical protein
MTNETRPVDPDAVSHEASTDLPVRMRTADRLGLLLTSIPKWAAWAVIAWQIRLSIEALAGVNRLAPFLLRFGRETSYWELGCWAAGLLGIMFGIYNRHLLQLQITKAGVHMTTLENRVKAIYGNGPKV